MDGLYHGDGSASRDRFHNKLLTLSHAVGGRPQWHWSLVQPGYHQAVPTATAGTMCAAVLAPATGTLGDGVCRQPEAICAVCAGRRPHPWVRPVPGVASRQDPGMLAGREE